VYLCACASVRLRARVRVFVRVRARACVCGVWCVFVVCGVCMRVRVRVRVCVCVRAGERGDDSTTEALHTHLGKHPLQRGSSTDGSSRCSTSQSISVWFADSFDPNSGALVACHVPHGVL
jgi:hypothetical protein